MLTVRFGDNLPILRAMRAERFDLIYVDPPFNTGKTQFRRRFRTENGRKVAEDSFGYADPFDDFIAFLRPRMEEARRVLKPAGSLFLHLDFREVHYAKVMLDGIFGR